MRKCATKTAPKIGEDVWLAPAVIAKQPPLVFHSDQGSLNDPACYFNGLCIDLEAERAAVTEGVGYSLPCRWRHPRAPPSPRASHDQELARLAGKKPLTSVFRW